MDIVVRGTRSSPSDWDAVQNLRADQLPALTTEQRATAAQLHISEEDYARSAFAGRMSQDQLLVKSRQLAQFLTEMLASKGIRAALQRVELDVWEQRFEIVFQVNGKGLPVRIQEDMVDRIFEGGSVEAERGISRILDRVFQGEAA